MRLRKTQSYIWIIAVAVLLFVSATLLSFRFLPKVFADSPEEANTNGHFVTIFEDGAKTIVKTTAATVGELVERLGITYAEYDIIEPTTDTPIDVDDFNINIYHSRPVLLKDGNVKKYIMTFAREPRSLFEAAGITVYDDDEIAIMKNQNFFEVGLVEAYEIHRGEAYAKAKAEAEAKAAAEKAAAEAAAKAAARPTIRPEWSTCANWARRAGVSEDQLPYALTIIYHESNCRVEAKNARSGAYGIPQALPGTKMASAGVDWQTNPVTQIRWMAGYVTRRYGGWEQALNFWNSHHWY